MHADLERLIRLQRLDSDADLARRTVAGLPDRIRALDDRLTSARAAVDQTKQRLVESQAARRAAEKDLAAVQGRLSKYRDQLMEVKTNREYQAMQKEIEVAERDVRAFEDRILERMLEADELQASVKEAERALAADQEAVAADRAHAEEEARRLEGDMAAKSSERDALVREIPPQIVATYDLLVQRRGTAVAEARSERCTACHVRMRPQIFNEIRHGEAIFQCESCQRVLYFAADAVPSAPSSS